MAADAPTKLSKKPTIHKYFMSWLSISVLFFSSHLRFCPFPSDSHWFVYLFRSACECKGIFGGTTWFKMFYLCARLLFWVLRISFPIPTRPTFACYGCGHLKAFYHNRIEEPPGLGAECSSCGHGLPDCFNGFLALPFLSLMRVHCAHTHTYSYKYPCPARGCFLCSSCICMKKTFYYRIYWPSYLRAFDGMLNRLKSLPNFNSASVIDLSHIVSGPPTRRLKQELCEFNISICLIKCFQLRWRWADG